MKKVWYSVLGFCLLFIGFSYFSNSISGITGFVILDDPTKTVSSLVGILFTTGGLAFLSAARRKRKGQAAMEFLMTYGWAILASITAIGILAYTGIFSPNLSPVVLLGAPFYSDAWSVDTSNVYLEIRNSGIETYTIQSVSVSNCGAFSTPTPVGSGNKILVTIPCTPALQEGDSFKGDVTIIYRKSGSSLDQISTGTITDKVVLISLSCGTNPSPSCDLSLSCANDVDRCDCGGECTGTFCSGNLVNDYSCKSTCAQDGKFAPSLIDCCNDWDPITEICETQVVVETCFDLIWNQDETFTDCGGSICIARCANSEECIIHSDCISNFCASYPPTGICQDPTCFDTVQNQDETGVDCGGVCVLSPDFLTCPDGTGCTEGADCTSGFCDSGTCAPPPAPSPSPPP